MNRNLRRILTAGRLLLSEDVLLEVGTRASNGGGGGGFSDT